MINVFARRIYVWCILVAILGLAACGGSSLSDTPPAATPPVQETEHPPTEEPLTVSPPMSGTETAAAQATEPVPGLLLATENAEGGWGLSVVTGEGSLRGLVEEIAPPTHLPEFDVSHDGQQILYAYQDDIWLLDVTSGENRNVTQTPDRSERIPRWWPNREDVFVCSSDSGPLEGPDLGYLTLVGFDGTYEILDETGMVVGPPALSPDGQQIAYGHYRAGGSAPAIYHLGEGKEAFELAAYGVTWAEKVGAASWSPDGDRLAWTLLGAPDDVSQAALVTFNLQEKSHQLIHRYTPARIGDLPPAPRWGAGGEWLLFYALADDREARGLWLADLGGNARQLNRSGLSSLARVQDPALSPDGRWLAFATPNGEAVGLMAVDEWEPLMWRPPEKVGAVGWLTLPDG